MWQSLYNFNILLFFQQTFKGAARLTYGQNADEHTSTSTTTTEASTTKGDEELTEESAPAATETITNNGQRRSTKSDVSFKFLIKILLIFHFKCMKTFLYHSTFK